MSLVEISQRAADVCAAHWWPEKTRCHNCPIHTECTAHHAWSLDGLNQHAQRINAAAERVAK